MANTTCANCGVTLNTNGSPMEDPNNTAGLGQGNRFCSMPCFNLWVKRNEQKAPSTVLKGPEG